MRQIAAGLFISLDGVVEAPEKWTGPYFNDQVGQAVGALMATNDAMLLGRVTYEGFAAAFGKQDFRVVRRFDKFVEIRRQFNFQKRRASRLFAGFKRNFAPAFQSFFGIFQFHIGA